MVRMPKIGAAGFFPNCLSNQSRIFFSENRNRGSLSKNRAKVELRSQRM
jgi:hypothetical protein